MKNATSNYLIKIYFNPRSECYGKGKPTVRKKLQDEFWVGDVGAPYRVVTNSLTNSRVRTRHIIYLNTKAKQLKKFIHQFQHILSLSDVTRESPGYRTLLIIPGKISRTNGKSLKYPVKIDPPLAWEMFLAAKDLCTIICKEEGVVLQFAFKAAQ